MSMDFRSSMLHPISGSIGTTKGPLGGGRQITRNRASYSCHTCRRRKVKCDKTHPICGNCVKNNTECIYDVASQRNRDLREDTVRSEHGVKRRRATLGFSGDDADELQSVYGHLRQMKSEIGQKPDTSTVERRLDKLMSMIETLSGQDQAFSAAGMQRPSSATKVEPYRLDDLRLNDHSGGSEAAYRAASPRRPLTDPSGDEFPIPSGQATDLVDPVGSLNLGHLSLEDGGRSRYVGTTYWAYISDEINELNQLLREQNHPQDQSGTEQEFQESIETPNNQQFWRESIDSPTPSVRPRSSFLQQSIISPVGDSPSANEKLIVPEMLDNIPTKRQSHILYKGFMSGIHAISPVIHPPTILKLYNSFWNWFDCDSYSGEAYSNPSFIPLLYAIWYGGSVTISIRTIKAEFHVSSRSALSMIWSEEVTKWLNKIDFPRSPTLQGLAAYLIVQTIVSKEEEPLTSSLFVSLAMRVAQTMGLHRDPAKFGIEPCEAEYRRRLWWHIMHMDGVVAMSSGLPPLISDDTYWDVCETSEIKDTLIGTPGAEKYEGEVASGARLLDIPDHPDICGGSSMVNVYYLTARGKYIMARAVRRILKIQLGTKPLTRQDMEDLRSILLELQLKLNSIINRIPESLQDSSPFSVAGRTWSVSKSSVDERSSDTNLPGNDSADCAEQYHSPALVYFHKWARIILSLYIDKAFCVAYQPFLKNARSRVWPAARQSALRHCHGFMNKFIQLATDPDFQPFHWSWPGNHQPMHATMIMLIDLYERPRSPEASKSRAFIDRILALSGPDGGVVGGEDGISTQRPLKDGGREAWDMIRRLRQKAWQKAGLNPHILWTEKDQIYEDQIYADFASPVDHRNGEGWHSSLSPSESHGFHQRFYNITRSHHFLNPTITSSSIDYSLRGRDTPKDKLEFPVTHSDSLSAHGSRPVMPLDPSSSDLSCVSGRILPQSHISKLGPLDEEPASSLLAPSNASLLDSTSPNPLAMGVPTPPSMVDPNLSFDWDQWDAVFGQHLPISDDLMELDAVSGLDFTNMGTVGSNAIPSNISSDYPSGLPQPFSNNVKTESGTGDWPSNH